AHAWPFVRDGQRLADARRRVAELPLGSGAIAGSGFVVDRVLPKEALVFRAVSANALDVTGDRDFVAEVLFAIALVATHLSRLGAELVQYASSEYGFVRLADDFSTGSSLMPQKRNPDVFELARAKSGRLLGDLVALLTTLKGIPAGYSKDLQEDKALLFDACDTLAVVLPAVTGAIASLGVDPERMRAALDASLRATDLADLLVEAGVPFRESHTLVGKLVREAERAGVPLDRVPQAVAGGIHPALGAAFEPLTMVPVRRALRLVIDRKAEIVEADGSVVRSERLQIPRPAVIRLVKFVHVPRRFRRQVTNTFLFARDNYRCQFCGRSQHEL